MRTRVDGGWEHTAVTGTDVPRYRCCPAPLFLATERGEEFTARMAVLA